MKSIRAKKHWNAAGAASCLLLLTAGCVFTQASSHETRYYDLDMPEIVPQKVMVLSSINNATAARQRMLYRHADGRITHDEYNLWIQQPEQLLTRYWFNMLSLEDTPQAERMLHLRAVLTAFEIDLRNKKVIVALNYEFRIHDRARRDGTLRCTESFAEETPEAFAAAFSTCARKLGHELLKIGAGLPEAKNPASARK